MKNIFLILISIALSTSFTFAETNEVENDKEIKEHLSEEDKSFKSIAEANESSILNRANYEAEYSSEDDRFYGINKMNYGFSEVQIEERGLFCKVRDKKGNVIESCIICDCRKLAASALAKHYKEF